MQSFYKIFKNFQKIFDEYIIAECYTPPNRICGDAIAVQDLSENHVWNFVRGPPPQPKSWRRYWLRISTVRAESLAAEEATARAGGSIGRHGRSAQAAAQAAALVAGRSTGSHYWPMHQHFHWVLVKWFSISLRH